MIIIYIMRRKKRGCGCGLYKEEMRNKIKKGEMKMRVSLLEGKNTFGVCLSGSSY